jgi:hypothetical protein
MKKSSGKLAELSFQYGKFLGYYDLTLTATRTWNEMANSDSGCKFTYKKRHFRREIRVFIKQGVLKKKLKFFN